MTKRKKNIKINIINKCKKNIIFVILMLSLLGIDIKSVKILSFNFSMFCHFSAFADHMDGIGKKKVDIRHAFTKRKYHLSMSSQIRTCNLCQRCTMIQLVFYFGKTSRPNSELSHNRTYYHRMLWDNYNQCLCH